MNKSSRPYSKKKKSEEGQSLTEVAVSFTLMVLILAAIVDGGRIFASFIAVRDAAEEGALYGAYMPSDSAGIEARTRGTSSNPIDLTDTSLVTVSSNLLGSACAGNSLQVTVTYSYTLTMPFLGGILGTQSFPLSATATTTILSPPC